ncbi:MAG: hypothetical protein ABI867_13905 [Kofleriaceae bacterium]
MPDGDDVLKGASRFFSKLGEKVKDAGSQIKQTSKHVTGIGRGSVKLEVDSVRVPPGGSVRGRVVLALPEAVEAKRFVVTLHARQKVMTISKTSAGKSVGTSHSAVYQFDHEVGGAKSYESGTHAFELPVPPDALDLRPSAGSNPVADTFRTIASALSPSAGPIEWQVTAKLEIAWGRDLSHDVDIVVQR